MNGEPPSFSGDVEMLLSIRNPDHPYWRGNKYESVCGGEDPINIQCRSISGVAWNETGQNFEACPAVHTATAAFRCVRTALNWRCGSSTGALPS